VSSTDPPALKVDIHMWLDRRKASPSEDSPPYLHDGRLLTLDDVIEFFNLVLGTKLSEDEKRDLLAYLYCM
jgi:hypothetical protein